MKFKVGDTVVNPNWNKGLPLTVMGIGRIPNAPGKRLGYRLRYASGRDYWFEMDSVDESEHVEFYLPSVSREYMELFI